MKNQLNVTLVNGKLVLTETKVVITETVVLETLDTLELSTTVQNLGYKNAKFTEEAKVEFRKIEKETKLAARLAKDTKRQEREAKKAERVAAAKARVEERIAKLQARLGKFGE
jgi:hypothetical protein